MGVARVEVGEEREENRAKAGGHLVLGLNVEGREDSDVGVVMVLLEGRIERWQGN